MADSPTTTPFPFGARFAASADPHRPRRPGPYDLVGAVTFDAATGVTGLKLWRTLADSPRGVRELGKVYLTHAERLALAAWLLAPTGVARPAGARPAVVGPARPRPTGGPPRRAGAGWLRRAWLGYRSR